MPALRRLVPSRMTRPTSALPRIPESAKAAVTTPFTHTKLPRKQVEEVPLPRVEAEDEEHALRGRCEEQQAHHAIAPPVLGRPRAGCSASPRRTDATQAAVAGIPRRACAPPRRQRPPEARRSAHSTAVRGRSARGTLLRACPRGLPRRRRSGPWRTRRRADVLVARVRESIDEPRVHRPRLTGETESDQDRGEDEHADPEAHLRRQDVEHRCDGQRPDAEQERRLAADGVGHHPRRNLENQLPHGEARVDDHHREDVESRIEQEEGVHRPDERCRQGEEPVGRQVRLDDAR